MQLWQGAMLFALFGFLCGSIPFGWLAARLKGIDLRAVGSGNIGGTNAWRALGWKWGLAVMLLDALKGLVPVVLWLQYSVQTWPPVNPIIEAEHYRIAMLTGLAAILGHTFTPWLKFKGGKGVATGAGVLIALFQWWALIPLAVFGAVLGLSRMVSLGSICAALALAATSLAVPAVRAYWPFAVLTALLVLFTHRENIVRILAGNERRIGRKAD